jgi:hypothetical protein
MTTISPISSLSNPTTSPGDGTYAAITPTNIPVTNVDNDTAGIILSPLMCMTNALDPPVAFTVSLATAPAGIVVLDLASSDTTMGVVSTPTVSFMIGDSSAKPFSVSAGAVWGSYTVTASPKHGALTMDAKYLMTAAPSSDLHQHPVDPARFGAARRIDSGGAKRGLSYESDRKRPAP